MQADNADNDISVGSFNIPKVKQAFSGAHDMLQVRLFERVNDIAARRSGRSTAEWQPGEMSILNAIMGATHDVSYSTSVCSIGRIGCAMKGMSTRMS